MPRLAKPITAMGHDGALTVGAALDRWYVHLNASDRIGSPRTIASYRYATGKLVDHITDGKVIASITTEDLEALFAALKARGLSPAARSAVYRPLRTFFRWATERGLVPVSPMDGVSAPKVQVQPVEFVSDSEWAAIVATTKTRSKWAFRARRDRAILLLLGSTGARLSEIAGLRVSDVDVHQGVMLVHGKGGKDRKLPLLPDVAAALDEYLRLERPRSAFSGVTDALWLAPKGAMTASGIAQMLADRGYAAGLRRRVHPHELRHRFVAQTLAAGMPGPLVMALSGHSTASMLNRYGAHTRTEDAMAMYRAMAAKQRVA
jgi:integrase/recombinase XerD